MVRGPAPVIEGIEWDLTLGVAIISTIRRTTRGDVSINISIDTLCD